MTQLIEKEGSGSENNRGIFTKHVTLIADCNICDFRDVTGNSPYQVGYLNLNYQLQYLPDKNVRENAVKAKADVKANLTHYHHRSSPGCKGVLNFRRL